MKAPRLLTQIFPERLLKRHHRRHSNFHQWGEKISPRGLIVTEEEVRLHHRLEAQNEVQRYAN